MRKFLVKIYAYQYYATFEVFAEDNVKSIEDSIVDKLGDKSINWEYLGEMNDPKINRITYEEVIDGKPHPGALPTEKSSRQQVGAGA